jgi:hypothetical protein
MKKMLKTSAEGRRCMFANCNRILSIYNHERYCHLHLYQMAQEERIRSFLHTGPSVVLREK